MNCYRLNNIKYKAFNHIFLFLFYIIPESPKNAFKLEANLETIKKEPIESEFKENKEDFTTENQFEQNIK